MLDDLHMAMSIVYAWDDLHERVIRSLMKVSLHFFIRLKKLILPHELVSCQLQPLKS